MQPSFLHFLLFATFFSPSHANPSSLVLGLTHSTTLSPDHHPHPPSASKAASIPKEVLDMLEPVRSFRDGYLISLNLGTPPQVAQVYMDTGSDLTWVPCGNISFDCMDCDYFRSYKLVPTYSPSYSSSSSRDLCSSPHCINLHSSDNDYDACTISGCSLATLVRGTCTRPCPPFSYTYGAGGLVTGTLTRDTLRVHGSGSPAAIREVQSFCFGCVGAAYREPVGIVGFGRGPLSLPSQLGFLKKGFSHCFLGFKFVGSPNITSPLVIGDLAISSKDYLHYTSLLPNPIYPNYYYIGLEAITIGNSSIIVAPLMLRSFDAEGNGGLLIDSGTTYTHLPEPLYSGVLSTIGAMVTHPRATEVETGTGFDLCYRVPRSNTSEDSLPFISFQFVNNVTLVLPEDSCFYPMTAPSNSTVVKCLLLQSMEEGETGPAGIYGNFQQQNVEVVYDLEKGRIGFQPTDCASSAAFHGLHRP